MTRGELVIIAATILVVLAVFLWIAVVKIEGVVPGGSAAASPARPPAGLDDDCPRQDAGGNRSALTGADCKGGCGVIIGGWKARLPASLQQPPASLAFAPAGIPPSPQDGPGGPRFPSLEIGWGGGNGIRRNRPPGGTYGFPMKVRILPPPPLFSGGRLAENRTGRAAEREVPSAASARLPRADAKMAQARLVCLFDALRQVESGGDDRAVGDGGRSLGPYQCGCAAWADGGGNPADYDRLVWDRAACERVMLGYWKRYGAVTDEQKARTWNGGPRGAEKRATEAYWHRVKGEMR